MEENGPPLASTQVQWRTPRKASPLRRPPLSGGIEPDIMCGLASGEPDAADELSIMMLVSLERVRDGEHGSGAVH